MIGQKTPVLDIEVTMLQPHSRYSIDAHSDLGHDLAERTSRPIRGALQRPIFSSLYQPFNKGPCGSCRQSLQAVSVDTSA